MAYLKRSKGKKKNWRNRSRGTSYGTFAHLETTIVTSGNIKMNQVDNFQYL